MKRTLEQNIDEVTSKIKAILLAKNQDYTAGDADYLSNFRSSSIIGVHPVLGVLLRVMDKIRRIQSFVVNGQLAVSGEGMEDAVLDIVGYMILIYCFMKESTND